MEQSLRQDLLSQFQKVILSHDLSFAHFSHLWKQSNLHYIHVQCPLLLNYSHYLITCYETCASLISHSWNDVWEAIPTPLNHAERQCVQHLLVWYSLYLVYMTQLQSRLSLSQKFPINIASDHLQLLDKSFAAMKQHCSVMSKDLVQIREYLKQHDCIVVRKSIVSDAVNLLFSSSELDTLEQTFPRREQSLSTSSNTFKLYLKSKFLLYMRRKSNVSDNRSKFHGFVEQSDNLNPKAGIRRLRALKAKIRLLRKVFPGMKVKQNLAGGEFNNLLPTRNHSSLSTNSMSLSSQSISQVEPSNDDPMNAINDTSPVSSTAPFRQTEWNDLEDQINAVMEDPAIYKHTSDLSMPMSVSIDIDRIEQELDDLLNQL